MNRCVFFALNRIAWLVRHNISTDWAGFWDKKCCRLIIYLSKKGFSSVTVNWFGPDITQGLSIFFYMIKTIFLTSTIICFLSDEKHTETPSPPLSFLSPYQTIFSCFGLKTLPRTLLIMLSLSGYLSYKHQDHSSVTQGWSSRLCSVYNFNWFGCSVPC